jgi:mannose-1-phosphate guanylyltransferase
MNYAVILAGGMGERFWPASTPERPKQLLPLLTDRSMLRETADRLDDLVPPERLFVITSASLVEAVAEECPEIPSENVIGEPEGKNTAPAIGLMAGIVSAGDRDAVLLSMPADHAIGDLAAFRNSVESGFQLAAERPVVALFGVVPSRPETGYGYVERGDPMGSGSIDAYSVARFEEKPDAERAQAIWQDGRHYWNSGLFCARASVFLEEYATHLPLMRRTIESATREWGRDRSRALGGYYASVESTSIDHGIMQQTDRAVVLPADGWGWDDIGSWESLGRWVERTEEGNVVVGDGVLEGCREVVVYGQEGRIAVLGMEDCVIVRTKNETLVVARESLDRLKPFVQGLIRSAE